MFVLSSLVVGGAVSHAGGGRPRRNTGRRRWLKSWAVLGFLALVARTAAADPQAPPAYLAWTAETSGRSDPEEEKVRVDHDALLDVLSGAAEDSAVSLAFPVGKDVLECLMVPSHLISPELQAKYPEIKVWVGGCSNGGSATIVINEKDQQRLSVTLYTSQANRTEIFYVDHSDSDSDEPQIYTVINRSDLDVPEGFIWGEPPLGDNKNGRRARNLRKEDLTVPTTPSARQLQSLQGFRYRIAIVTTKEYSNLYGNTKPTVLNEVVRGMARVNGIYLRELGIMFELIGNTDDLFCLDGEVDCSYLANSDLGTLLNQATNFITTVRRVSLDSFDIGHVFAGNDGGGLASSPSACGDFKAEGASSLQVDPFDGTRQDAFFVDVVCHEVSKNDVDRAERR